MAPRPPSRTAFGIAGLDAVLEGGLPSDTLTLVQGRPGCGKTTLALQFLMEGARNGDTSLFVSNAETPAELEQVAASHGWNLSGVELLRWEEEGGTAEQASAEYTLFPAAEVEVGETFSHLFAEIERLRPARLAIDSISALRVLARDPAFYRRQLRRLRDFLAVRACTTVVVDDLSVNEMDARTQTLSHGIIELEQRSLHYGGDRRRLRVRKLRGSHYLGGYHDFSIETGGIVVYPRLVASAHELSRDGGPAESGLAQLDALAGGGLPRGSSTLLLGPAGSGKSSLSALYACAAAERGERASMYLFDESVRSLVTRCNGLGIGLERHIEAGRILLNPLDPAELSPGQIAHQVVQQVEGRDVGLVVVDTLNGYLHAASEDKSVLLHLRELLTFLSRRNVVTLLTLTQHGVFGKASPADFDFSYLADNVFLLRYFEANGSIRQALSLVKRRSGAHERTIRELELGPSGVRVGPPLEEFSGVLTGTPQLRGASRLLDPSS